MTADPVLKEWIMEERRRLDKQIKKIIRKKKRNSYKHFMSELEGCGHTEMSRRIKLINRARGQRMSGLPDNDDTIEATERHFSDLFAGLQCSETTRQQERDHIRQLEALHNSNIELLESAFDEEKEGLPRNGPSSDMPDIQKERRYSRSKELSSNSVIASNKEDIEKCSYVICKHRVHLRRYSKAASNRNVAP
ncbi:hypothetical protein BDF22DRAFT_652377 [Syncephalis plumigaleata]|nr:hypothetical protein BDF22DRAFT_652377 [Syncephalis plumigaleata]